MYHSRVNSLALRFMDCESVACFNRQVLFDHFPVLLISSVAKLMEASLFVGYADRILEGFRNSHTLTVVQRYLTKGYVFGNDSFGTDAKLVFGPSLFATVRSEVDSFVVVQRIAQFLELKFVVLSYEILLRRKY